MCEIIYHFYGLVYNYETQNFENIGADVFMDKKIATEINNF
jgi:hypothetical protein